MSMPSTNLNLPPAGKPKVRFRRASGVGGEYVMCAYQNTVRGHASFGRTHAEALHNLRAYLAEKGLKIGDQP